MELIKVPAKLLLVGDSIDEGKELWMIRWWKTGVVEAWWGKRQSPETYVRFNHDDEVLVARP